SFSYWMALVLIDIFAQYCFHLSGSFVDHFVMKLRLVKFARTEEYNELFSGDPTWVTESIGGMALDGRTLVT
ncbi:hypothetical protein JVV04_20500, partial [Vibrio cholerae O1]|nr:hypothetical protein [Vibrio cholerae O1]